MRNAEVTLTAGGKTTYYGNLKSLVDYGRFQWRWGFVIGFFTGCAAISLFLLLTL